MSSTTAPPPIPAIATSIPMGAMSISPHTPAIPSRLSAASNIDYGDEIGGGAGVTSGGMVVPPPMTAPETEVDISNARNALVSPVKAAAAAAAAAAAVTAPVTSVSTNESASVDKQESSSDSVVASTIPTTAGTEMPVATTTVASAAPIDIPSSSPRRYLLSTTNTNRRPVSAAPKPRGRAANEDESDDFLPFVKTLSLGNEDVVGRVAPSVGELLRGRSGVRGDPVTSAGAADRDNAHGNGKGDVKSSSSSSPRLAKDERNAGTGVDTVDRIVDVERLPAQPSFSLNSGTAPTTSAISAAATARRSVFLPHRPSFHRPQSHKGGITRSLGMQRQGSVGSLDEDEPLLFAMSDVGASRRSLECKEREKENRKGGKREAAGVGADVEMAEQMDLEN
ncbi:hypothetical protein KEM56_000999 [Ascosphaera pollenicola]|nr:hypothetical protein KEM56_000999 [Ascosphaera pollenicola]